MLVGAMTRGSWWLLDSANTCSASVELSGGGGGQAGGRREGDVEAQVVIMPRQENFRVFYCMTHLGC